MTNNLPPEYGKDIKEIEEKEVSGMILNFLIDRHEAYERKGLVPTLEMLIEDMGSKRCKECTNFGADETTREGEPVHSLCHDKLTELPG